MGMQGAPPIPEHLPIVEGVPAGFPEGDARRWNPSQYEVRDVLWDKGCKSRMLPVQDHIRWYVDFRLQDEVPRSIGSGFHRVGRPE